MDLIKANETDLLQVTAISCEGSAADTGVKGGVIRLLKKYEYSRALD